MARLVHRRRVRAAASDDEAKGPGATLGPLVARLLAPFSWIGRLSLLASAAYLLLVARPLVTGERGALSGADLAEVIASLLGSVAVILLPAALEYGGARRNGRLLMAFGLLAAAEVLRPIVGGAFGLLGNVLAAPAAPQGEDAAVNDPMAGLMVASSWFAIVLATLAIGGWATAYRGLVDAGARPARPAVVAVVMAVLAVAAAGDMRLLFALPEGLGSWEVPMVATDVVGLFANALLAVAASAAAVALLAGAAGRLLPRLAWRLGAAAGIGVFLSDAVLLPLALLLPIDAEVSWPPLLVGGSTVIHVAGSLLLFAACLAGLGRGTGTSRPVARRSRAFVVHGERHQRAAGDAQAM